METYLALVPRGTEHVIESMVRSQLLSVDTTGITIQTKLIAEEIGGGGGGTLSQFVDSVRETSRQQSKNKKRFANSIIQQSTCSFPVGTVSNFGIHKSISFGYDQENKNVWTAAGMLRGTVWMEIRTNAPVSAVLELNCIGPLLAVVDCHEGIDFRPELTLDQARCLLCNTLRGTSEGAQYASKFKSALKVWEQVRDLWIQSDEIKERQTIDSSLVRKPDMLHLKYRLSCLRADSAMYSYTRQDLLKGTADYLVPTPTASFVKHWTVDLTKYDIELVLLVRPHAIVTSFSLRPYQHLNARSFNAGTIPPDVSHPYLTSSGLIRLRPATAHVLLHLAQLEPYDVVLDPCAGIGTIPIEACRRHRRRSRKDYRTTGLSPVLSLGGDLVMTEDRFRSLYLEYSSKAKTRCDTLAWDACNLPIRTSTIDVVVSDLPFGQQCLSSSKLHWLLPLLLSEMARVLRPTTGRIVLLCGSYLPVLQVLQDATAADSPTTHSTKDDDDDDDDSTATTAAQLVWRLPCHAVFPVTVGGTLAWMVCVHRGSAVAPRRPTRHHAAQVSKRTHQRHRIVQLSKHNKAGKLPRAQA